MSPASSRSMRAAFSADAEAFDVEHAAAQVLVASLERQLVNARSRVAWFNVETRKRARADLEERYPARAAGTSSGPASSAAASGDEAPAPGTPPRARAQRKASPGPYVCKVPAAPPGLCPTCWSELVRGYAGARHPKAEYPDCRLNFDMTMADFKQLYAGALEVADEDG